MIPMPKHSRLVETVLLLGLLVPLASTAALLAGCPPGGKTVVEAGVTVKIGSDNCKEDRTSPAAAAYPPDMALLDCVTVEGTGTIRVSFPRKEWNAIRQTVSIDAGPGK